MGIDLDSQKIIVETYCNITTKIETKYVPITFLHLFFNQTLILIDF